MISIRSRIVFTLVTALIVTGIGTSIATYYSTRDEFSAIFDAQLRNTALEISERGSSTHIEDIYLVGQTPQMGVFVQIYDASTNSLFTSHNSRPLPISESIGFSDTVAPDGTIWRQYTSAIGTRIVQVAQSSEMRDDLAVSAALRIIQPMLILIPFMAIAIWFVIVQALQPLNRTAKAVSTRSPTSLEPISTKGLPFELKSLVQAINNLMARLSDSLHAQQRFASDAAHELRTPLAAIKLQAQLLARAKNEEAVKKHSDRLQQGVARATRLVEQLLTIARLDPDAAAKPTGEVDLSQVALATQEELSLAAAEKSISLEIRTEPVLMIGMEDSIRLMVTNLTDNAIRYTPDGGRIEIGVCRDGDQAKITITDNGPGINPQERERVFERFYRALGTKVSGTGLGLAIVSRIVQLHHGSIHIEDGFARHARDGSGDGFGAQFVVRLPLTPPTT